MISDEINYSLVSLFKVSIFISMELFSKRGENKAIQTFITNSRQKFIFEGAQSSKRGNGACVGSRVNEVFQVKRFLFSKMAVFGQG